MSASPGNIQTWASSISLLGLPPLDLLPSALRGRAIKQIKSLQDSYWGLRVDRHLELRQRRIRAKTNA